MRREGHDTVMNFQISDLNHCVLKSTHHGVTSGSPKLALSRLCCHGAQTT